MDRFRCKFENDVKIYGIQTKVEGNLVESVFENDVKIYGIQTADGRGTG